MVMTVYFGRMAEELELSFGEMGQVGPRYQILDGIQILSRKAAIFKRRWLA